MSGVSEEKMQHWTTSIFYINSNDGYYPDITVVLKQVEIDLLQSKRDKAVSEYLDNIKSEYKIYINPNLQI